MTKHEKTRRHPRVQEVYEYFLTYQGHTYTGKTREISPYGAGIYTEICPQVGDVVDFNLSIPGSSLTIMVKGVIRSCVDNPHSTGDSDRYLAGIEFTESIEEGAPLIAQAEEGMFFSPSHTVTIDAPAKRCYEIACDFERYFDWVSGLEKVEVLEKHPDGRGKLVEFSYNFFIRKAHYVLDYSYNDDDNFLCWNRAGGDEDILDIGGSMLFKPLGPAQTYTNYELNIVLSFIPSQRLVNWATSVVMRRELRNLKKFAEKTA